MIAIRRPLGRRPGGLRNEVRGGRIIEWYGMSDRLGILLNAFGKVGSVGRPAAEAEFIMVDDAGKSVPFVEIVSFLSKSGTQNIQHVVLNERGRTAVTWDREKAGFGARRARK